ncbi:uncharacterized protein RSE6_06795 [Rhynchosporium secalis]|uniref:Uncharacterized protein n=1 Tax=Rhynchosporium secalis TaxID=38038 RepID=A0A1E1MB81_RHYSE|nr:uncharacterized protein RSE6_06795 [Rhynchosporium secalis]
MQLSQLLQELMHLNDEEFVEMWHGYLSYERGLEYLGPDETGKTTLAGFIIAGKTATRYDPYGIRAIPGAESSESPGLRGVYQVDPPPTEELLRLA